MITNLFKISKTKIRNIISAWENDAPLLNKFNIPNPDISPTPNEAAVLIPLFLYKNEWNLLFTRRNQGLQDHSGQVSFPGGRSEPGDKNKEATALRETFEEIGILSDKVEILGNLPNILTITNFNVTPVVGVIPWPYPLKIAENEVSRVFSIPLFWLADSNNYSIKEKFYPGKTEPISVIFYSEYDGELLWGVTARIVATFITILLNGVQN
jgi:8-oxo-dGTP pyrophosphatase MutT (NUDIX family)